MATQPLHKDRKQYVTVEEAQIIINRSERTIRRWIEKQRVHVIRDASGYVRIDLDDLEQVREQQPLTIHPVQQRIQLYDSQIAAVEDRCTEHEQQIAALQQQIHDLYDLLHTVLHGQPPGEEGEPAAGRLLSLLATLSPTGAPRKKNAEWQTSHEKLSFQSSQIGSGIFAEAKLPLASFLPLLQLSTQIMPSSIILGS